MVQCNVSEVLLEPKKQNKTEDQNQWTIMTTYKFIITMKSLSHINLQKHSKKNRRHNNNNEKRKTKTCNDIHWFQSNHFYSGYRTTKILTVKLQDQGLPIDNKFKIDVIYKLIQFYIILN